MKKIYLSLLITFMFGTSLAQNIIKLEFFVDTDPGYGSATNVSITASSALSDFKFDVPVSSLSNGFHTLYVRVQNANNKWSMVQNRPFVKLSLPNDISRVEYFIDTDPGFGSGTEVSFTAGASLTNLTFSVPMTSLTDGYHTLYVRVKDSNNKWSIVQNRPFVKIPAKPDITYIEYYIDTDPGQGKATSVVFTPTVVVTDLNFSVDVSKVTEGTHKLYVRVKNANNKWSSAYTQSFSVCNLAPPVVSEAYEITNASFKFKWDAIPGATSYDADLSKNNFETFSTGHITGLSAIAPTLTAGTTYQYRVRAVSATCSSINSNIMSATTLNCIAPVKPTITISNPNTETPTLTSSATSGNQWFKNGTAISGATSNKLNVTEAGIYKVQVKSGDCVSAFSDEMAIVITATEPTANGITVYPNPVETQLTLTGITKITESIITDALGREQSLIFLSDENGHHADVHHLTPGMYLLRVHDGITYRLLKFIRK